MTVIDASKVCHGAKQPAHWVNPAAEVDEKLDELAARDKGFEAVDSVGLSEVTAAGITLPMATEVTNQDTAVYALSSNRVTISKGGTYPVAVRISVGGVSGGGVYGTETVLKLNGTEVSNGKLYVSRS
jgi:hypothetical protein